MEKLKEINLKQADKEVLKALSGWVDLFPDFLGLLYVLVAFA